MTTTTTGQVTTGLQITVHVNLNTAAELADVADVLGELLKLGAQPGITVAASPVQNTDTDRVDRDHQDPIPPRPSAPPPTPSLSAGTQTPPKRIRDRTAERRAKREREREEAERAAGAGKPASGNGQVPRAAAPDGVGAGDQDAGLDLDPDPFGMPDEPVAAKPAATTSTTLPPVLARQRTEQGHMDAALVMLRLIYDTKDGALKVKELQKQYKVSKFTDMPLDQAPALFRTAYDMATQLGVTLPQGL